jgi:general secretion pathway protein C
MRLASARDRLSVAFDQILKKNFFLVLGPLVAIAASLNAQGITQLVGVGLAPDEKMLTAPPAVGRNAPVSSSTTKTTSADAILARNAFDHVTGPLFAPAGGEGISASTVSNLDTDDIYGVPSCDGVKVLIIAASSDEEWSFAAMSGSDGKSQLRRRGGDVGGKKVHAIGWDRVWLENAGSLCQARLVDKAVVASTAPATSAPAPSATPPSGGGAKAVDPAIAKGIQKRSATEFDIDRATLDKILENQADLMRQARVVPEQENGRTVGIRMMGIRPESLLGTLGMENGDRLQTINGFDMSSPEKALEAYARLRTADKLTVQINRRGQNMNLDYTIK